MRRLGLLLGLALLLSGCGTPAVQPVAALEPSASAPASTAGRPIVSSSSSGGGPASTEAAASPAGAGPSPTGGGAPSAGVAGAGANDGNATASAAGASVGRGILAGANGSSASATARPSTQPTTKAPLATIPPAKRIGPLLFISQTLNNCGPASIAEVLNYFGTQRSQTQVAAVLRPDLPAYGMSLYGVPFYAESIGMKAVGGVTGSDELVKAFVANDIPIIVSDQVSVTDHTRHFRPIDGYNDQAGYFIGSDPYLGPNHQISYAEFDDIWRISANRWVVVYPPFKQDLVDSIVARYGNRSQAVQAGLQRAEQRLAQQPKLPWSWLELADMQIDSANLKDAGPNIQKGIQLGLPFEAHWLQLKLQRAGA